MTTARALSIGFVGNVVTNPFGKVSGRLADLADATCEHFPIGKIEQVLAGPASVDVLVVHLDHRWFFDVAPDAGAVARAWALTELVSARLERGPGTVILNTVPFVPASSVESDLHDQLEALARLNGVLFDLARSQERVSVVDAAGALAILSFANALRERNRLLDCMASQRHKYHRCDSRLRRNVPRKRNRKFERTAANRATVDLAWSPQTQFRPAKTNSARS